MSEPERCLQQAEEAERMASLVSYERDRVRLMRQAAEWRERAAALEAQGDIEAENDGETRDASPLRRLLGSLLGPRGPRGG